MERPKARRKKKDLCHLCLSMMTINAKGSIAPTLLIEGVSGVRQMTPTRIVTLNYVIS